MNESQKAGISISATGDPLCYRVDLDDRARRELVLLMALRDMSNLLYEIDHKLQIHAIADTARHVEQFTENLAMDTAGGDSFSFWESFVGEERAGRALSYLAEPHCGDCICVSCSCMRCSVEQLLGVDTTAGLSKHELRQIPSLLASYETSGEFQKSTLASREFVHNYLLHRTEAL